MNKNIKFFLTGALMVAVPYLLLKIDDWFSMSNEGSSAFQYFGVFLIFTVMPVGVILMIITVYKILTNRSS